MNMAFPKNFVCVNLVDFPVLNENEKIFAKKIFLPIVGEKYYHLFGFNCETRKKIFLCVKGLPECFPKNFFKKRNRKFNGFFLLSALNNSQWLRSVNENKLARCCQKKNVQKWIRAFEKNEIRQIFNENRTLYFICALILSCCKVV